MKAVWTWLDGNKTIFGLALLALAQNIPPDTQMFGFIPLVPILQWLGGLLAGIGVAHKANKIGNGNGKAVA